MGKRKLTMKSKERIVERVVRDEDEQSEDIDVVPGYFDQVHSEGDDSACEEDVEEEEEANLIMPPDKDKVLSNLPPRTHNFIVRGLSGSLLITSFVGLVCMGPSGLLTLSFVVLTSSFAEVMKLGYSQCQVRDKKTRVFCWSLFFLANYTLAGPPVLRTLVGGLQDTPYTAAVVQFMARHHSAAVFFAYLFAIAWFVTSMKTGNYLGRYALFGWCHTTILLTVIPVHMINQTLFSGGMIFYVCPMIIITINDICAYYVGFFFGKTPLIKLSPKKTFEGYVGGGILTVSWALPSPHSASTFLAFYVLLRSTPPLCLMSVSTLHPFFHRAYSQFKAVVSTRFLYLYHSRWGL